MATTRFATPVNVTSLPPGDPAVAAAWGITPEMIAAANPAPPVPAFNPYSDPGYIAGAAAVNNTDTHAGAYHDYTQLSAEQNYGYDPSGNLISATTAPDPHGGYGGYGRPVGPNPAYDPYSQAAQLQRSYDATQRGTVNNYAAQGQLYSGALLNKQGSDTYNFNSSSDALKRAAQDAFRAQDYSLQQTKDSGSAQLSNLIAAALANFTSQQQAG